MPTEIRQISFRQAEVVEAIVDYYQRRGGEALPAGELRVEIIDDGTVSARIGACAKAGGTGQVAVPAETLAAALVLYCVSRHIPIPARAEKRLQRVGDSVAILVMRREG